MNEYIVTDYAKKRVMKNGMASLLESAILTFEIIELNQKGATIRVGLYNVADQEWIVVWHEVFLGPKDIVHIGLDNFKIDWTKALTLT